MTNYNKESAQFVLKTCDLPMYEGTNSIGSMLNPSRTNMRWTNVDLKTIMGTLYDKYDTFSISLVAGILSPFTGAPTTAPTNTHRTSIVSLNGLSFKNSTYSLTAKSNLVFANIGILNLVSSGIGTIISNASSYGNIIFGKSSPIVDLTIQFRTINDSSIMDATGMGIALATDNCLPPYQLIFRIEPIKI